MKPIPIVLAVLAALPAVTGGVDLPRAVPGFTQQLWPGQVPFREYGPDEGLESLGLSDVAQDKDGFLWVATDMGLFYYDGHRFKRFDHKNGLPSDTVNTLWADPTGGVWASCSNEVVKVTREGATRLDAKKLGLPSNAIIGMAWDGQGRHVLAMGRLGVWRQTAQGTYAAIPGFDRPWEIAPAPKHGGVIVTGFEGRARLLRDDGTWDPESYDLPKSPTVDPLRLLEDGLGRLWLLDSKARLYYREPGSSAWKLFDHPLVMGGGQRRNMKPDGQGGLWTATVHGLLNIRGTTWRQLTQADGLPSAFGVAALVDREGTLWYASGALYRQLGNGAWFYQTTRHGLPTEIAWAIDRDAQGRLWVGTERGIAVQEAGRWTPIPGTEELSTTALVSLPDGAVVATGGIPELFRVEPKGRTARRFVLKEIDPKKVGSLRLVKDDQQRVWVVGDKLYRVEWRQGTYQVVETQTPPKGIDLFMVGGQTDAAGRIWLACENGLILFDHGTWHKFGKAQGLKADSLSGVCTSREGDLWICYRDAMGATRARWDGSSLKVLKHYQEADNSLPTDGIFSCHQDLSGNIWMNTNLGAVILRPDGFRVFGRTSGFMNQDMVQGSFLADPQGGLWFGTSGGLVRFESAQYPWHLAPPQPVLAQVRFKGNLPVPDKDGRIRILPRNAALEVQLGCLSFSREKAFHYEVRLKGLETDWRTETLPQVRYPAIPSGNYEFQVRIDFDGKPGPVQSYAFEILPRWYETWMFRLAVLLGLGGAAWGLARYRHRRLEAQNRRLEELVQARTHELADANRKLEELSLTDPLTGLHNRRFLSLTMPEQIARLQRELENARRSGQMPFLSGHPLTFIILDVDHFKRVNDEFGHGAGDQVLVQLGQRLTDAIRDTDTVIRWGGEEFLVVARSLGSSDPATLADRILQSIRNRPMVMDDGLEIPVTASAGFCPFPLGNELPMLPWDKAVMLADRALYAAKRSGRDRWVGLDEGPAFDAHTLLTFAGHPDIPKLVSENLLHVLHAGEPVPPEVWL